MELFCIGFLAGFCFTMIPFLAGIVVEKIRKGNE